MTITDRIEVNPRVMLGKPVIRGTRIPVEGISDVLVHGSLGDGPHAIRSAWHTHPESVTDPFALSHSDRGIERDATVARMRRR
jgi:hypothetical protein